MMTYVALHEDFTIEHLGFLPLFLSEEDPRPAAKQYDDNYVSGWSPMPGWTLAPKAMMLKYPGDPPMLPFAATKLHGQEAILFYPHAIVMILQIAGERKGSFEVARLD